MISSMDKERKLKNPKGGLNEKGRKSYERETAADLKSTLSEGGS